MDNINNQLLACYILARYAILCFIRTILENDAIGKDAILQPEKYVKGQVDRDEFIDCMNRIIKDIVVDLNMEVYGLGNDYDYKSRLRDDVWVKYNCQKYCWNLFKTCKILATQIIYKRMR